MSSKKNIEAIYPLSPLQEGMLFHSLYAPESGVYFEQLTCTLDGALQADVFKRAWQIVVDRHAILRTSFSWEQIDRTLQIVHKKVSIDLDYEDWRSLSREAQAGRWQSYLLGERERGFDLAKAPLMRFGLRQVADEQFRFAWHHHHLLLDGWSLPVVFSELLTVYAALCQNQPVSLPAARPFKNYIDWLRQQDETAVSHYWQKALQGFTAPTPLVVDQPIAQPTVSYDSVEIYLPAKETAVLTALAQNSSLTLSTIVQGAWALLLHRYSGADDVLFGSTVAGRSANLPDIEQMVGLFINTLPVRSQVGPELVVIEWLQQLQAQLVEMRHFEFAGLTHIQSWSEVPRNLPLFESIFVFENYPVPSGPEQNRTPFDISEVKGIEQTNYPLTVVSAPGAELLLRIAYDGHRFDQPTIERLLSHWQTILLGIAADPHQPIDSLPLLTESEQEEILWEWNQTEADFPSEYTITQLFEQQVEKSPTAVALEFEDQTLTFEEINSRANQLARCLQKKGIGPGSLVGLCLEPCPEVVVSLLGILKAGAAYLPLEPSYPPDRLAFMLADAQPALVLTQQSLSSPFAQVTVPMLTLENHGPEIAQEPADNLILAATPDDLAYVIYTSGSTGRPKGTLLAHQGLVNFVTAFIDQIGIGPASRVLQFASLSFDASVAEIFTTLLAGGTLCLASREKLTAIPELTELLQEKSISSITLPPAVWQLLDPAALPKLQTAVSAGEACPPTVAQRWATGRRFFNGYGPTETSIGAAFYQVLEDEPIGTAVSIGKAIANTQLYILDPQQRPVPVGVPGELYIGGVGLAQGYLNRPELTAERFVEIPPFNSPPTGGTKGGRLYKTGDLCRWLPDGRVAFLGRVDQQVKIRGFRIELGEIESVLLGHEAVRETAVLAQTDEAGQKQLVAYLVMSGESAPSTGEMRQFLAHHLPPYMVPAAFVLLEKLPRLPNGKIDRRALAQREGIRLESDRPFLQPSNPAEEIVAGIWAHFLPVERVGIFDDFHELGGHSLLATQIVSRIRRIFRVELPLRELFDQPTVAGLTQAILNAQAAEKPEDGMPLEPAVRPNSLPLSFAQQRIWFLDQLEPGNLFYNIPSAIRLSGKLDEATLQRSLNEIVRRHEALRTIFAVEGGKPRQQILPELSLPMPVEDLQNLPEMEKEAQAQQLITREVQRPFSLITGPLLRLCLLKLGPQEHIAILTMHHIISDGWSMNLFVRELSTLYQAFVANLASPLPDLPLQYADYAQWQQQWLQSEAHQRQLAYWEAQLKAQPLMLDLPTDHPRPAVQSWRGAVEVFDLPPALTQDLRHFSRQESATLFMTLLAAFQTLLYRYTGQTDISVGTAVANRNRAEIEDLIGFFVNTLVMRTDLSGQPTFRKLLQRVRDVALGAYAHQELPFEMLVEALQPQRDLSHTPLFQAAFALQSQTDDRVELAGLSWMPLPAESGTAKFDITLELAPHGDGLRGYIEYNRDLFEAATIQRLVGHYQTLLTGLLAEPERPISQLPLLTSEEAQQLLVTWNQSQSAYPDSHTIHQHIETQAARQPTAIAVEHGDSQLSYDQLNRQANQLAHHLQKAGVGPDSLVGIATERSPSMVIALLGVLKAGGAYLPLDPSYPAERLAFMIQDSQIKHLLSQSHLASRLPQDSGVPTLQLDRDWPQIAQEPEDNPQSQATPDSLAYAIYTSGSTGQPKGALLTHRGLSNLSAAQQQLFNIQARHSRILQFSPLSFDASVWETFMALANGATLVLAQQESLAAPDQLAQLLADKAISNVTLPPSMLSVLPQVKLPRLETIIAAGEACPAELVQRWGPGRQFYNAYGPTETTVCAAIYPCDPGETDNPPIGRPLANFQLYVLDPNQQPVPVGVPGELCVGGVGVGRGYHNRPELTAERFVKVPQFTASPEGGRLYRTGDLVRWRADGNLEFLGRLDHQVKVRGFRIELAEIESVLRGHPAVAEAVIVAHGSEAEKRLIAYVGSQAGERPSVGALRRHLQKRLPEYMVPNQYMVLEALPQMPNGKVDRGALPEPDASRPELERAYVEPRNEVEAQLADIWAELLALERVGVEDNFFELGGHSLLATQLLSRIHDLLHVDLPVKALFEAPTVAGMAEQIYSDDCVGDSELDRIDDLLLKVDQLSDEEVLALLQDKKAV